MECGYDDGPVDMMRYGVFPISPKKYVYISFETLDLISTMSNFNPLLSNASVTNALNFISTKRLLVSFIFSILGFSYWGSLICFGSVM